ncbi:MAG: two-component system heavy metal sensor histidine kinase CusS [Brevundimonas sp.]|jgi:two-component system heavy metal sensor histidine kinase CusS
MFGAAAAVTSAVVGCVVYILLNTELERRARDEIQDRFSIVERQIATDDGLQDWAKRREMLEQFSPADESVRFFVVSPDPAYGFAAAGSPRAVLAAAPLGFQSATAGSSRYLTLAGMIPAKGERPAVKLVVAGNQARRDAAAATLAIVIIATSFAQMLIVSGLGWFIARRGMQPVDRLSDHARRLRGEDPSLRLPAQNLPSELAGLVLAFNDALQRLEDSHRQLSDFNADVAHELRTPLTNLIGETEISLAGARDADALRMTLQSNLEDLERLRLMINDMLLVARAEAGEAVAGFAEVSLAAECRRAAEFMEVLLDEAGLEAVVEGDAVARVDRTLLGRALTNLLDNAVRHGRSGRVRLLIVDRGDAAIITVINPGGPIPEEHLPRLFERFFCGDASRASDGRSHGLGLAIVAAVARMHGGKAQVANGSGVVEASLVLPRRAGTTSFSAPAGVQA